MSTLNLTTNLIITQSLIDSYTFPVTIINDNTTIPTAGTFIPPIKITFYENLNLTGDQYFIIGSEYLEFDGLGNTITFTSNTSGLFQNGTNSTNGFSNINIKNMKIDANNNVNLNNKQGWLCQDYYGRGISYGIILIENCCSLKNITGTYCGGITGEYLGSYSTGGKIIIQNCFSIGDIIGEYSGGIVSGYTGLSMNGGEIIIQYCYSVGNIENSNIGGILGNWVADNMNDGTITISNCYYNGSINNDINNIISIGGIASSNFGVNMKGGLITIQNCYIIGEFSNYDYSGSISGNDFGVGMTGGNIIVKDNIIYYTGSNINKGLFGRISEDTYLKIENNKTQTNNNWNDLNAINTIYYNNIWGKTNNLDRWLLINNIENDYDNLTIINGTLYGNLEGNVNGDVTGNVIGNLNGDVNGNIIGDVTGNVNGNVIGNLTGNLTGDVTGNLTGDVIGNLIGDVIGNLTCDINGDVIGNLTGDVIGNLTGDVNGDVIGNLTGDLIGNILGNSTVTNNLTVNNDFVVKGTVFFDNNEIVDIERANLIIGNTITDNFATLNNGNLTNLKLLNSNQITDGKMFITNGNITGEKINIDNIEVINEIKINNNLKKNVLNKNINKETIINNEKIDTTNGFFKNLIVENINDININKLFKIICITQGLFNIIILIILLKQNKINNYSHQTCNFSYRNNRKIDIILFCVSIIMTLY